MPTGGRRDRSDDELESSIGAEERVGTRPAAQDAHDVSPPGAHEPTRRVEDAPAQRLGLRLAQVPSRQSSWNQRTRSAAIMTVAIQVRFASRSEKGKGKSPESFSR